MRNNKRELIRNRQETALLDAENNEIEKQISNVIQLNEKKIKEIDEKIKNNDYNEYSKINHDKMVLENRKMILENRISSMNSFRVSIEIEKKYDSILTEIVNKIYKDDKIDKNKKEKILNLLTKLKPKKMTINTGLIKAEWYDDSQSTS